MVMNSRPPPPPPTTTKPTISMVGYGLLKRIPAGESPFYAVAQSHTETTIARRQFWQGIAIDTADRRVRRFANLRDAVEEAQFFMRNDIRVDAIIYVDEKGQKVSWERVDDAMKEVPPADPDAGSW